MSRLDIIVVETGIWTLEEDGKNVFLVDCQKFGILKSERKELLVFLREAVAAFRGSGFIDVLIERGNLKKLSRQKEAVNKDLWEIRRDGDGARILFVRISSDVVVVAAVDKGKGSLSQAVNRGVKRWKNYLKTKDE